MVAKSKLQTRSNRKITRKYKKQTGGADDIDIYYKKTGIVSFGAIRPSTDPKSSIQQIDAKQLYTLPIVKINTIGIKYKFEFFIKNYDSTAIQTSYSGYNQSRSYTSGYEKFAEYTHKHNRFMSNNKSISQSLTATTIDKWVKKYRQITIQIKVSKLTKTTNGDKYTPMQTYYFNLELK